MAAAEREAAIRLYDERALYSAVVQQGRSTGDGHIRVGCPARCCGKVRCPLVGGSLRRPLGLPTVDTPSTPDEAPGDCCRQETIQVPATGRAPGAPEVQLRHVHLVEVQQQPPERRERQLAVEDAPRTSRPLYIRCLGRKNQQLLLTFSIVSTNLLTCVACRAKHGLPDPEGIVDTARPAKRAQRAKRRKGTLKDILRPEEPVLTVRRRCGLPR